MEIIRGKAKWITIKQLEYKSANTEIVRLTFREGSTLPYLGTNYPFRIVNEIENNSNEKVELRNNVFLIPSRFSRRHIQILYEEWLFEKAKPTFEQKSKEYSMELDIIPPRVIIKNLRKRWGSATKTRSGKIYVRTRHFTKLCNFVFEYLSKDQMNSIFIRTP